ncbi:MAG: hypothetical protein A2V88_02870 [Elusimicrobia bacterium RBG_16_66_12]|nr:MAG: hypothetical protein A2V88_02870 [Elusimicrobia bacterium RBG_16_66_12]
MARVRRRFAEAVRAGARVQAAVLLTAVYFLVLGPAALLTRLLGVDLLCRRRAAKTGWTERAPRDPRELLRSQG